ncbi:MAG: diguanylate cyclase [Desulfobacteraceae bacterium]|nr:diguanylate cyclase [Desulfobacteraceae bacterium]
MPQNSKFPAPEILIGQIRPEENKDFFENAPMGIFISTPGGRFSYANKTMALMLGYESPKEMTASVTDIAGQVYADRSDREIFKSFLIMKGEVTNYECRFVKRSGKVFWVSINARRLSVKKQEALYYQGFVTDIDERKQTEKELKKSRELLKRAQEIAHIGSWEFYPATDSLTWSDEVYRIFGVHPGKFGATYRDFLDLIHPGDSAMVNQAYLNSLESGDSCYEIEHRIVRKNTCEIRYVHEKCFHERDRSGTVIRSVGIVQDITGLRQTENALRKSEELFQKMLALVPDMISIQDSEMNIVYSNWNGFAAVPEHQRNLGTKCHLTYRGYDHICPDCPPVSVFDSKKIIEKEVEMPGGIWLNIRVIPILDSDGNLECFVEWARDITEQKHAEEKLKTLATTDALTGLWNRRYFLEKAALEINRAGRYGGDFSLLMIDIDDFKNINDTYGHAAGDAVLKQCAITMNKQLRQADLSGRLGGEEFGMLLPNTGIEDALLLAERLRQITGKTPVKYEGRYIFLTVSIGAAAYQQETESVNELFLRADRALYRAKREGRNRVKKSGPAKTPSR